MVICAAYLTLAGGTAWANDEALRNGKPHVAEIVTLARLAPRLCGGILADEAAIQALMDTAGLSERATSSPPGGSGPTIPPWRKASRNPWTTIPSGPVPRFSPPWGRRAADCCAK